MLARWVLSGIAAGFVTLGASQALAVCNIAIVPGSPISIGKIVPNTTVNGVQNGGVATTFTEAVTGGSVSQSPAAGGAGVAILLHPPSNVALQVTFTSASDCHNNNVPVVLAMQSTGTTSVNPNGFTMSPGLGTSSISATSLPGTGGSFTLNFQNSGNNMTAVLNIGYSFVLPAHSTSGTAAVLLTVKIG